MSSITHCGDLERRAFVDTGCSVQGCVQLADLDAHGNWGAGAGLDHVHALQGAAAAWADDVGHAVDFAVQVEGVSFVQIHVDSPVTAPKGGVGLGCFLLFENGEDDAQWGQLAVHVVENALKGRAVLVCHPVP
jgi:hypothetical protein